MIRVWWANIAVETCLKDGCFSICGSSRLLNTLIYTELKLDVRSNITVLEYSVHGTYHMCINLVLRK